LNNEIKIFSTPHDLALGFAEDIVMMIHKSAGEMKTITIALSGGNTPKLLFSILAEKYSESVPWNYVSFFWGDERCVPPEDPESNFGMAKILFFDKINIPQENIHRFFGEHDAASEVVRYSAEIETFTRKRNGWPVFDLIILGLGEDGHTASIFPGNSILLNSENICEVAVHPVSQQKRLTITGRVIKNSENIAFMVAGRTKAEVVSDIIERPHKVSYPAAGISPGSGKLIWYLDSEAASKLGKSN
jgi:6-phosphogluconolactonase